MTSIEEIKQEARYIVDNNATIRQAAKEFGCSKSSIHSHMEKKLSCIDNFLYQSVRKVLDTNKAERAKRGGRATQEKFRKLRELREP